MKKFTAVSLLLVLNGCSTPKVPEITPPVIDVPLAEKQEEIPAKPTEVVSPQITDVLPPQFDTSRGAIEIRDKRLINAAPIFDRIAAREGGGSGGGGGGGSQGAVSDARTGNDDDGDHFCMNGRLDEGEECDDGNAIETDGCNNSCELNLDLCSITRSDDSAYIICNFLVSWEGAREHCQSFGPFDLVTISSAAENTFLFDLIDSNEESSWIGFNDIDSEGNFVWISGQPNSFTNWNMGEPNDADGEDCTELYTVVPGGVWNDAPCDSGHNFICELNPIAGTF